MNPRKTTLGIFSFFVTAASISFVAGVEGCGGDDNANPTPTIERDAGTDSTTKNDSGGAGREDSGKSGDSTTGSEGGNAGGPDAADAAPDVSLDTGSCTPDSSTCNSCYTDAQAAQDPYNACSPYTVNCVPFTTAVPTHPTL